MFKRVRDLIKRSEPTQAVIELSFEDLPAWLDDRKAEVETEIAGAVGSSRQAFLDAVQEVREVLGRLEETDGGMAAHPRLKDISRKALPQFVKSMNQTLSRDLPDEPEAFYAAAAEILKGAIKALKGQGKYLSALHPEEMKEIRTGIRVMGREINAMTETISGARERTKQIDAIRGTYSSIIGIREEYVATSGRVAELRDTLARERDASGRIEESLADIRKRPDYLQAKEIEARIDELKAGQAAIDSSEVSVRTAAVHIFRKAEKGAERAGDREGVTALRQVLDALSRRIPERGEDVVPATEAVMPVTLELIRKGEFTLKNREEIRLFSDPDTLPAEIRILVAREKSLRDEVRALQEAHAALSSVAEERRLRAELADRLDALEEAAASLARTEQHLETLQRSFDDLHGELPGRVTQVAGQDVSLHVPGLPLPPA
jgi:hypothetical protein